MILTVSKASIPGFTLDMHKHFRDNLITMVPKIDDKLSITDLPDFEGCRCFIQHIKMPMIMTNRSLVQLYYLIEHENGNLVFISSSRGTDEVIQAQKAVFKKDVVANNIINATWLQPTENGCDWVSVQALDVAGSIPETMKSLGAKL